MLISLLDDIMATFVVCDGNVGCTTAAYDLGSVDRF